MNVILIAVISLGAIALVSAAILYIASKKFAVYEDPRIAQVGEVLPQANCGGCGYPGCSGFADACVKAGSLEGQVLSGRRTTCYDANSGNPWFGCRCCRTDGGSCEM